MTGRENMFSNGLSNGTGVAILFPSNFDFELCDKKCDNEGRLLLLKVKIQSCTYLLFNVYSPTHDHKLDQNKFASKIKEELSPFANENIILGVDFNFDMDPKLDKMDNMSGKNDDPIYRKEIIALLNRCAHTSS